AAPPPGRRSAPPADAPPARPESNTPTRVGSPSTPRLYRLPSTAVRPGAPRAARPPTNAAAPRWSSPSPRGWAPSAAVGPQWPARAPGLGPGGRGEDYAAPASGADWRLQ